MSVFKKDNRNKSYVETHIKDFTIERMKKGESPSKIKANIKKMFDADVSLMFVWRVRKQYMRITGKYLKSYREIYKEKLNKRNK